MQYSETVTHFGVTVEVTATRRDNPARLVNVDAQPRSEYLVEVDHILVAIARQDPGFIDPALRWGVFQPDGIAHQHAYPTLTEALVALGEWFISERMV